MGKLLVKDKEIVTPGEELATGMDFLPAFGVFREKEKLIASIMGLVSVSGRLVKLIPLAGRYEPKRDDIVIGKILDMTMSSWFIDINHISDAVLSLKEVREFIPRGADLSGFYDYGDWIAARIANVSRRSIELSMKDPNSRKLDKGRIIKLNAAKIPRVIGRQGSMISLVKDMTGCRISVGQNGYIWLKGEDAAKERLAVETLYYIQKNAHKSGLTEMVKVFLEKNVGGKDVHKKK